MMPMKGILGEVFEITGRGVVACLEDYEGEVRTGERLIVANREWTIAGVEMPYGKRTLEQLEKGLPVTIAVVVRPAEKSDLVPLIGQPFETC